MPRKASPFVVCLLYFFNDIFYFFCVVFFVEFLEYRNSFILTDFMRTVRQKLNEQARQRGRQRDGHREHARRVVARDEQRLALAVKRPESFVKVTFDAAPS